MKFTIILTAIVFLFIGFMVGFVINVQKDKSQTNRLINANRKYQVELNEMESMVSSLLTEEFEGSKYFQAADKNKSELNFTGKYSELKKSQLQFINKSQYIPDKMPVNDPIITKKYQPEKSHYGIDLAGKRGDSIYAAASGVVKSVSNNDSVFGKCMVIDHLNGYETFYGHNSRNIAKKGYFVKKGKKIAEIGKSGQSSAPHLHFEIRYEGQRINPTKFIK
ncbi:MAG: M23 family metallopeptidase [Candidatus Cloacimonadota bacterium]|nr:M23 family metallopeptidase [Candidatus Cloacimonadota bacterium]